MKILHLNEIEFIAEEIKKGKSVVFPTETVYGIGTNALDEEACNKIFALKERPKDKPLIVLVSDFDMLYTLIEEPNKIEQKLIETFWPGPLTIVFSRVKEGVVPKAIMGNQNSIGIRMTNGKIAQLLIQKAGVPVVAPSANISGKPTETKIKNIIQELGNRVDYILDCGDIQSDITSTVVKVEENKIRIIRQGKITKEMLSKIGEIKLEI